MESLGTSRSTTIRLMIDDCLFVAASVDEIKQKIFRRDAFRCNSNFNSLGLVAKANSATVHCGYHSYKYEQVRKKCARHA